MDRNLWAIAVALRLYVASREGGVDRNMRRPITIGHPKNVASREGGVDRNFAVEVTDLLSASGMPVRT